MYVFVDMEWISNQRGNHWPTQLAAARVDAHWNTVDTLSVLFRPRDFSLQQWGHMAFSGWSREQFLDGESLYAGLDAFRLWLQPEDTVCWWHQEASDLFNMFSKVSGVPDMTQHVVLLCDYIYGYLWGKSSLFRSLYATVRLHPRVFATSGIVITSGRSSLRRIRGILLSSILVTPYRRESPSLLFAHLAR